MDLLIENRHPIMPIILEYRNELQKDYETVRKMERRNQIKIADKLVTIKILKIQ